MVPYGTIGTACKLMLSNEKEREKLARGAVVRAGRPIVGRCFLCASPRAFVSSCVGMFASGSPRSLCDLWPPSGWPLQFSGAKSILLSPEWPVNQSAHYGEKETRAPERASERGDGAVLCASHIINVADRLCRRAGVPRVQPVAVVPLLPLLPYQASSLTEDCPK